MSTEKHLNEMLWVFIIITMLSLAITVATYGAEPPIIIVEVEELRKEAEPPYTEAAIILFLAADIAILLTWPKKGGRK
jgi:hypothetical protein